MDDPRYEVTSADRQPRTRTQRYRGYRGADWDLPYARFFTPEPVPPPPLPSHRGVGGYEIREAADRMTRPGYEPLETGWARTERGTLFIACLTDMPGVTAAMWDWWFGWHGSDSARYKLWHPRDHLTSTIGEDRSSDRSLTDRQRYQGNVSYVAEYIGPRMSRLAIRFVDPVRMGFPEQPGTTVIAARVGPSDVPVAAGWLVHQIRPTPGGAQMRSRFFLGHPQLLALPTRLWLPQPLLDTVSRAALTDGFARDLLEHCATEMHHLAGFLPQLYEEFREA